MTGPTLDLDALRELSRLLRNSWISERRQYADSLDAVLALVDEQRDRISTLEEYVDAAEEYFKVAWTRAELVSLKRLNEARDALAGSPAEKKQP